MAGIPLCRGQWSLSTSGHDAAANTQLKLKTIPIQALVLKVLLCSSALHLVEVCKKPGAGGCTVQQGRQRVLLRCSLVRSIIRLCAEDPPRVCNTGDCQGCTLHCPEMSHCAKDGVLQQDMSAIHAQAMEPVHCKRSARSTFVHAPAATLLLEPRTVHDMLFLHGLQPGTG